MNKNKYLSLFLILLITFTASAIGGFTTTSFKEPWYSEIILPSFNPPSWVFPPVWTILYIMMSVAIWKIWINTFDLKILKLYFIHLFFNGTWSIIFFWFSSNWISFDKFNYNFNFYYFTHEKLFKRDKISFYLMLPYFFWSSYALILIHIFIIN